MDFQIEGLDQAIAESNKPALDLGLHLATVVSVEPKHNENTGSFGFQWELNVNRSSDISAWDTSARTIPVQYYTWLGDMIDGKVVYRNGQIGWGTVNILKSLNVSGGSFAVSDLVGRALIVEIIHEPSQNDPDTLFAKVKTTRKFTQTGGEVAPKLFDVAPKAEKAASGESALPF